MPLTEDSINKYIIAKCECNENIWRIGETVQYTCANYPCYPKDSEGFPDEDKEDGI